MKFFSIITFAENNQLSVSRECFDGMLYATSMGITYIFSPSGLMVSMAIRRRPSFPKQILSVKQQLHYYIAICKKCEFTATTIEARIQQQKCVTLMYSTAILSSIT